MKTLAFGDSFVKMFIHCPDVKHLKFKGKSIKGLVKADDNERARIEREMRKTPNANRVLFIFGQVDFNYVRYYKVIKGQSPLNQETFHNYVKWVSTLNKKKNISIVSIFPSPIRAQHLIFSLLNKGSYLNEERTPEIDAKLLQEYKKSHQIWVMWNKWIADYCKQYKVDNLVLFKEDVVPPQFRDLSNMTIHLRYVPVLKLVQKFIPITFDEEKAEIEQKIYEKQKTDRIAQSISVFQQSTKLNQQKIQEKQEIVTKEQSSKTRDFSSPEDQCVHKNDQQQSSMKNYRKKTADEQTLSPERNVAQKKQILSDSQKKSSAKNSNITDKNIEKSKEKEKDEGKNKWKRWVPKQKKVSVEKRKYVQKAVTKQVNKKESDADSEDEGEQFLSLAYGKRSKY